MRKILNYPEIIFVGSITLFILSLLITLDGFKKFLFLRKINDIPVSKVSSALLGLVALSGRAMSKVPEKSPVSKIPCVYWRITVKYYSTGKFDGWKALCSRESKNPFFIEDDSGKILVAPEGAQIEIPLYSSYEGYIREYESLGMNPATIDEAVLNFIELLDADTKESFLLHKGQNFHVDEFLIQENDHLFVMGTTTIHTEDPSGRGIQGNLIVRRGTDDGIFYISNFSQRDLIRTSSSEVYLQIIGGLILSAVCLFLFLTVVGV